MADEDVNPLETGSDDGLGDVTSITTEDGVEIDLREIEGQPFIHSDDEFSVSDREAEPDIVQFMRDDEMLYGNVTDRYSIGDVDIRMLNDNSYNFTIEGAEPGEVGFVSVQEDGTIRVYEIGESGVREALPTLETEAPMTVPSDALNITVLAGHEGISFEERDGTGTLTLSPDGYIAGNIPIEHEATPQRGNKPELGEPLRSVPPLNIPEETQLFVPEGEGVSDPELIDAVIEEEPENPLSIEADLGGGTLRLELLLEEHDFTPTIRFETNLEPESTLDNSKAMPISQDKAAEKAAGNDDLQVSG